MIVVDYLQLIKASRDAKRRNRVDEITEITTGLKALAKDMKCPVIALSQLSRAVEGRDDKRPQLSDLRDSGSIEQDADVVMFVYRQEYYLSRVEPQEGTDKYADEHPRWLAKMEKVRNLCDVFVEKHRNGETGVARLFFHGATTSFGNLQQHEQGEIGNL